MMYYGNAEGFKEYHTQRGREISVEWTDEQIESALLVSSEWLDLRYGNAWVGYKLSYQQEREWPREAAVVQTFPYYVFRSDEIPEPVIKATYEAALRELTEKGSLTVDYTPNKYKSVRVEGAISVEYSNVFYASDVQKVIPVVDELMVNLLQGSANNSFTGKTCR